MCVCKFEPKVCHVENGMRLVSISRCDQVWRTCNALHDELLLHDELNNRWEDRISIDKEGDPISEVPFAVDLLTIHPYEMNSIKKHIVLTIF